MTDSLVTEEAMSAEERQSSLKEMVALALDVAVE
jgi:purine-nucleoside phosphorylase